MPTLYKILMLFLLVSYGSAEVYGYKMKVDTIYYDRDWRVVDAPFFASYYRIAEVNPDQDKPKHYRDFFITGELQGEGKYLILDPNDDSNSKMHGEYLTYYKSGKTEQKGNKVNGVEDGEYIKYYENGSIMRRCNLRGNRLDGLYTEFTENGLCIQMEYENGEPKTGYYTVSNDGGYFSKINVSTNQPMWESPSMDNCKTRYVEGVLWMYYLNDGLEIALTNVLTNDYGKYYRIHINITNRSFYPVDFDPAQTIAMIDDKKGLRRKLKIQTPEEYDKRIRRTQRWEEFFVNLGEGLAAANAGYSTSTTVTSYGGHSSTHGSAYAYGSGHGSSYGFYSSNTNYHGAVASVTQTYDAAAAYQAQLIASDRIASFREDNRMVRESRDEGYLKLTTIEPGASVSGYINVVKENGIDLDIILIIEGAQYHFPWSLVSEKDRNKAEEQAKSARFNHMYETRSDLVSALKASYYQLNTSDIETYIDQNKALVDWFEDNRGSLNDKQVGKWEELTKIYEKFLMCAYDATFDRFYNRKSRLLESLNKSDRELSIDDVTTFKTSYKALEDWFDQNKGAIGEKKIEKWEKLAIQYCDLLSKIGLVD